MVACSTAPWRALLVVCLATAGWAFTFGLGTQVATLWLDHAGLTDTLIGLNTGIYYLGIALAAGFVPGLMRRWEGNCVTAGMVLSGATLALFPWGGSLAGWSVLRLLHGMAGALSVIPLETYISRVSRPEHRSRNFGFYGVALTLGGALGIAVGLHLYQPGSSVPFFLGGATAVLAGLLLAWGLPSLPEEAELPRDRAGLSFGRNFLGFGSAWCQGFLEGGMLAFLSLYLLARGLSRDGAGTVMSVTLVGVILFQVPVAWLADRLGRTAVLLGCYAVVLLGLLLVPSCGPGFWLGTWLFLIGACSGAFYPLGLALLGERVPEQGLSRAYACYMTMECLGSIVGPVCMGKARVWWGEHAMFTVGELAVLLVLLTWAALRLSAGVRGQELGVRGQGLGVREEGFGVRGQGSGKTIQEPPSTSTANSEAA